MGMDALLGHLTQKPSITNTSSAQDFDRLWERWEGDPEGRASAASRWCLEQAPWMADVVEARVLAETPECPRRHIAVARLALARGAAADPTWRPKVAQLEPQRLTRPPAPQERLSETIEAFYERIYRVPLQIIDERQKRPLHALIESQEGCLRVDPELGRLAIVLHEVAPLRLWVVGRELVRTTNPSGKVSRQDLRQALEQYGVKYTPRHIRRVLAEGEGTYWNCDGERVFLRSWEHVATQLTRRATKDHVGDIPHNRPGRQDMLVPVAGSLEQWEAALYAAWFSNRNCPTIARETLEKLFGRDQTTLRRWEAQRLEGVLTVQRNYAQCPDVARYYDLIPSHVVGYWALVREGKRSKLVQRLRWQIANTYQVSGIRQHVHKGKAKKVRKVVNRTADMPVDSMHDGWHRLYFDPLWKLRSLLRKPRRAARLDIDVEVQLPLAYVWRGVDRYRNGVFEVNLDGHPYTHADERLGPDRRHYLQRMVVERIAL